jgi:RNA polymerase sigma factor (sigma-70 family)
LPGDTLEKQVSQPHTISDRSLPVDCQTDDVSPCSRGLPFMGGANKKEFLVSMLTKLRKLLRHRGRSLDEADDLIQEAFLRLQVYRRVQPVREPEAFLVRTVLNLAIDAKRQRNRRGMHVNSESEVLRLVDPKPIPDEVLLSQQRLQRLRAGLEALSPRTREVILLHRIEGFSHAQIAARLGVSTSTVERQIAKAALFLSDWMPEE